MVRNRLNKATILVACFQMPNPSVERDCAKARSPSLLRWALMPKCLNAKESNMSYVFLFSLLLPFLAYADGYSSPYGEWRGQTQYQAFIRTTSDPASHIVTNLTINVDPQGKVTGTSIENGCRMLGLAAPGIVPTIVTLNVTLTGCTYSGFNRTYMGSLSVFSKETYAKFSLQAIDVSSGKAGTYNITATMRR